MKTIRWLAIAFLTSCAAILMFSSASGHSLEHDSSSVIFDYEVTNDYGIRFADEYERLGGVHTLGYPASYRYRLDDGFVYQVTQGALLQWRPEVKSAYLANTFEMLEHAGFDQWLLDTKGIPLPIKDDGSDGDWDTAKEIRLAWLTDGQIKARFLANPNPEVIASWSENRAIELYGLPMSYPEKHGPFISQRFQRVALQLWVEEVAGMPAVGTVVRVLGGDLLKEACLIPSYALSPKERMSCASGSYVAQDSASQPASDHSLERESSAVIFDYEVTNDYDVLFADEYERLGGVHTLGYPASYRFRLDDGFTYQVTQGALLQWRPEVKSVYLGNTFEMLEHAGYDQWLLDVKGVPLPIKDDGSGGDWNKAREIRLSWLTNEKIRAKYFANPNPEVIASWSENRAIELYGLPMSYPEKYGPFVSQRFQRVAFQLWVEEVEGMPEVGTVVRVLGGDLLKEACLIPQYALAPAERSTCSPGEYTVQTSVGDKSMVVQITWVYTLPPLFLSPLPNLPPLNPPPSNSPRPQSNSQPPPSNNRPSNPPPPPPPPSPTISISALSSAINVGQSDSFTVVASHLDSSATYAIQVTTDNGGGIGFNSDCSDVQKNVDVPASSTSYTTTANFLVLHGCGTVGGTVTATLLDGTTTVDDATRDVTVQMSGSPTISIDGLMADLNEAASDLFTVSVGNLDSSNSYTIQVTTDNSDVGFTSDCTDRDETTTVTAGEMSDSASFTLYGCDSTGGIVTAKLLSDGNTVVSDTEKVKVNEPTITIQGLAIDLNEAASHAFTVGVDNLDSSSSYTIRLTTDDDDLGFNSDCSNRLHDVPVTANSTSFTTSSLTLYGCDAPGGTVTAILLRGTAEVAKDTQDVTVNEPTIRIVGLVSDVNQGASHEFVVSVDHLAASSSYTIQITTDNANIGFNNDCSLQQTDQAVPATQNSHTTASFTLYGCAAATETITAKLLRGGTEVKPATQDVTVNASTIAIEELDAPLNEEDSRQFTVRVEHLGSSQPYTIQITTNNANIGFNNDCSDQQEEVTVQNSTSHTSALLLYGCVAPGGTVTARLLLDSTEVDTDSQTVTVVLNPTIEITGLVGTIDQGENDEFTVAAQHLVSSQNYAIRVTAEDGIGFNSDCSNQSEPVTVPAGGSHSASLRLYACTAIGGTVTVNLLLDSNSIANDTQEVTVVPSPTISISDLATSIDVGASDEFTVSAQHLDSSATYSIRVTTHSGGGIGFNSDCTDHEEPVTVTANSQAFTSNAGDLVLYGCGTAGGTVTAKLLIENTEIHTATQPVTVQMAGSPTIAISGLVSELNEGASDSFTVSAANLDSSTSYTIRTHDR